VIVRRAVYTLLIAIAVQPGLLALINPEFLLLYLFPWQPSAWFSILKPFIPFLVVPFIAAGVVAAVYLYRTSSAGWRRHIFLNALIFSTFIATAEAYKDILILAKALSTPHDCIQIRSFPGSLLRLGEYAPAHAMMIKGDVQYRWSYRELAFVERTKPNPFYTCAAPLVRF
jgi:hypothetical protein